MEKYNFERTKKALENAGFQFICLDPAQDSDTPCQHSYIFERPNVIGGVQQVTLQHIYKHDFTYIDGMCPSEWGKRILPILNKERVNIKKYH